MSKAIMINSLILSVGILIGRLSGYIREIIVASKFGTTSDADTILLMLTIPDLLNNLLASGAVVGILIPLLNSHESKAEEVLTEFTKKLFFITLIFYIFVLTTIFFMYDFYLFGLLAVSLLSVFPNIFTFIITGYLQFEKKFKKQSLNTLIFNIVIIIFLLLGSTNYIFAIGVIFASIVRMIWIYTDLKTTNISYQSFAMKIQSKTLEHKTLIFMIFANGLMFINPMIDKLFAAYLQEGSVAVLSYAEKIYLLPVSVFLTTYAVAMFPDLSKLVSECKKAEITSLLKKSIGLNIIISLLVGVMIYSFSYFIVNVFFGIADLSRDTMTTISTVLNAYIISLIVAGTNSILLNLIFSYKWYKSLMFYSIIMVLCNIILDTVIIQLGYSIEYIAYATSFVSIASVMYLTLLYTSKVRIS